MLRASSVVAAVIVAMTAMLSAEFWREKREHEVLEHAYRHHFEEFLAANRMRQSTDDLTRLARTFVVTGDERFKKQYEEILEKRNGKSPEPQNYDWIYWDYLAVDGQKAPWPLARIGSYSDLLRQRDLTDEERRLLNEAREKSDELSKLEKDVFASVSGPVASPSLLRLHDQTYHQRKLEILSRVNTAFGSIAERANRRVVEAQSAVNFSEKLEVGLFAGILLASALWVALQFRNQLQAIALRDKRVAESERSLQATSVRLETALAEIKALEGLLSICSYCHSIKDEHGGWHTLEHYMSQRASVNFTHGICPQCTSTELAKLKARVPNGGPAEVTDASTG